MKANVKSFDDLLQYREWQNKKFERINVPGNEFTKRLYFNRALVQSDIEQETWYGPGTTYEMLETGVTEFAKPELLETLKERVLAKMNTEILQKIKKKKLTFNAMGLGIFSFDRAALSLYKVTTPGGNKRVRTSTKKLFAYFPKVKRTTKAVEIFVYQGGPASIDADDYLYSGLSAVIVSEILSLTGVKCKINIVNGTFLTDQRVKAFATIVCAKNYDQSLDSNLIALMSSDPRYDRYDGLKGLLCIYDEFGQIMPASFGSVAKNTAHLKEIISLSDYSNQEYSYETLPLYLGFTYDEESAVKAIQNSIQELASKLN